MKKVLLSNDDGIAAPGLALMAKALSAHFQVYVCSTKEEHSGMSHAITLGHDITAEDYELEGAHKAWMVDGTPVDSVKLALNELLQDQEKPDLVVSGINNGHNCGSSVLYSGTIACAIEGFLEGYPAIALSHERNADPVPATDYAMRLIQNLPLKADPFLLNMNFPKASESGWPGLKVCPASHAPYEEHYHKSGDSPTRYRLGGDVCFQKLETGSDFDFYKQGFVTLAPLQLSFTDHQGVTFFSQHFAKIFPSQ